MTRLDRPRARSCPAAALAALGCALGCSLALGACGSSSHSETGSGPSALYTAGVRFADCMRTHGISHFPDSSGAGGGIEIPAGTGIKPQAPAFQSAQRQCSKYLPGGNGPGRATESDKLRMLRMAQCMRKHGFSTFPDPTAKAPLPGTGFALAFGRPGSFIAIPRSLVGSPGFERAARACGLPGGGGAQAAPAP